MFEGMRYGLAHVRSTFSGPEAEFPVGIEDMINENIASESSSFFRCVSC